MLEKFKYLSKSELPSRQQFNRLSDVARMFAKLGRGLSHCKHGGSYIQIAENAPWEQFTFEITNLKKDVTDTDDSGLYLGKIIYYSFDSGKWKNDETKEWILDERGINTPPTYSVGDKLVAYWDAQRGAFIPVGGASGDNSTHWGKLDTDLLYNDNVGVNVSVWKLDSNQVWKDVSTTIEKVLPPPWMTEGQFNSNTWVKIEKVDGHWFVDAQVVEDLATDFKYDVTDDKLKIRTRKSLVSAVAYESAWTSVPTFSVTTISLITDVEYSGYTITKDVTPDVKVLGGGVTNTQSVVNFVTRNVLTQFRVDSNKLQTKSRDVYVVDAGVETAWIDVHSGTTC